jgi:hypothetical protein
MWFDALEIEEALFARTHSFRVQYRFLGCINKLVGDSGLWQPLGTHWNLWTTSIGLQESMFHNRGNSRLGEVRQNDAVINLCAEHAPIGINNLHREGRNTGGKEKGIHNEKPPEKDSWLRYEAEITPFSRRAVSQQSVIQAPEEDPDAGAWNNYYEGGGFPPSEPPRYILGTRLQIPIGGGPVTASGERAELASPDVIQQGGRRSMGIRFTLKAKRAGHPIPRPALVSVAGVKPIEVFHIERQSVDGNYFGQPVYQYASATDYVVPVPPATIYPPDDKLEWAKGKGEIVSPSDQSATIIK